MKILVTGGAGFIGSHIVDRYIALKHEVVILDNLSSGKLENLNKQAIFHPEDILSYGKIREIIQDEQPDVINHHAAQISVPYSTRNPVRDLHVNVQGTLNLLLAARDFGVKHFIFASSGGAIYGDAEEYPTSEKSCPKPKSPYAGHKLTSELHVENFCRSNKIDYTILRYSNIYGPRQTRQGEAGVVAIFIEELLNDKQPVIYSFPGTYSGMIRDYCYVQDVVSANCLALIRDKNDIYNISTCKETDTLTLLNLINDEILLATGRDRLEYPVKIEGPRPGDIEKSCLTNSEAYRQLGWRPLTDTYKAIRNTVKWWVPV